MRTVALLVLAVLGLACGRTQPVHYTLLPEEPDAGRPLMPCMTGVLTPQPAVPSVMLVIDRSGSMNFDFAGNAGPPFGMPLTGPRRWAVLRTTLEATLSAFDEQVAFGVVLFPANDSCDVSASIDLLPAPANATKVMALLNRVPNGGTPTFGAVNTAAQQLAAVRAQALVLITDGEPNCNAALDPTTCDCSAPRLGVPPTCGDAESCRDGDRAIDGLRRLRVDDGVLTYVVGVGAGNNTVTQTLDNMAIAGGVPRMGGTHSFYSGATESELTEALTAISTRLTRCTWTTGTRLGPNDAVEVTVGGQTVPQGDLGWDWVDAASGDLSLRGSWCSRAADGEEVLVHLVCR